MKISSKKIVNLITEQILIREYYRDFESRIKKFGFNSLEGAVNTFLKFPEFREFFAAPGKKIDAKAVLADKTHLATLDYLMDKMEDTQAKFSPNEKPSEEALQDVADEIEDEPEPTPQEIKKSAQGAKQKAGGLKLTKVRDREIEGVLRQMGSNGLSADTIRDAVKDVIEKLLNDPMAIQTGVARKIADENVPLILKIGDEIAKILVGDFSNLKENKRRKK